MKKLALLLCLTLAPAFGTDYPFKWFAKTNTLSTNAIAQSPAVYPSTPGTPVSSDSPPPFVSFQGLNDDVTALPPDTQGAVGPNHLVTMLNSNVRIQNRVGTTNYLQKPLLDWWTNAGTFSKVYDPKILYDQYNDRWIATAGADDGTFYTNNTVLFAVSQTGDPTGAWYYRHFRADSTTNLVADAPTMGFNKNWIAVAFNMLNSDEEGGYQYSRLYIFDKTNFYAGGTNYFFTNIIITNVTLPGSIVPATTMDNSISTLYCLNTWYAPLGTNVLGKCYLRLSKITGTPTQPVFTYTDYYPQGDQLWADLASTNGIIEFAPQTNLTFKICANDSRLHSVVYRNGFLWTAQTVFLPYDNPSYTAIQWWQISTNGVAAQVARISSPNKFYAFPTIAVNKFNDVLVGFSSFSATQYPSAEYSFRDVNDAPNTMRNPYMLKAGLGRYLRRDTQNRNRWGDYSATWSDPANDIDFWTVQEYADTPLSPGDQPGNGRWGVWWGNIALTVPANDNFANAFQISGSTGSTNGSVYRASAEAGEPSHAGVSASHSIWFKWSAPTNGQYFFDTGNSPYLIDTVMAVYTGSAVDSLTQVISADNGNNDDNPLANLILDAQTNVTYYIAVDVKGDYNESASAITLSWKPASSPIWKVQPPEIVNIVAGNPLLLGSSALGPPMPSYQWRFNSINLSGATLSSYSKSSVQLTDAGDCEQHTWCNNQPCVHCCRLYQRHG